MEEYFPDCVLHPPIPSLKEITIINIGTFVYRQVLDSEPRPTFRKPKFLENLHRLEISSCKLQNELDKIILLVVMEFHRLSYHYINGSQSHRLRIQWSPTCLLRVTGVLPSSIFEFDGIPISLTFMMACGWCSEKEIIKYRALLEEDEISYWKTSTDRVVQFWLAFHENEREISMRAIGKTSGESINSFGFKISTKPVRFVPMKFFWSKLCPVEKETCLNELLLEIHNNFFCDEQLYYFFLYLAGFSKEKIREMCQRYPLIPLSVFMNWRFRHMFQEVGDYFLPLICSSDITRLLIRMIQRGRPFCDEVTVENWKYLLEFENYRDNTTVGEYLLRNPKHLVLVVKFSVKDVKDEWFSMTLVNYLVHYDNQTGKLLSSALYNGRFETEDNVYYFTDVLIEILAAFFLPKYYGILIRFLRMFDMTADLAEFIYQALNDKFSTTWANPSTNPWFQHGREVMINILGLLIKLNMRNVTT